MSAESLAPRNSRYMVGAMDRAAIEQALARAERHVIEGDRILARQKKLIEKMMALGVDPGPYRATLARFEETQRLHIEHVRRLKQELSKPHGP
jgi:hypothetical protein